MSTLKEQIEAERARKMEPFLKHGMTPEPCIHLPLKSVLMDQRADRVYITLADLAQAFSDT